MEKDLKALTILTLISLISVPIGVFLNAYTFLCLWLWFIVPFGVPAIGLVHAMGILLVKGFLMAKYAPVQEDVEPEEKVEKLKGSLAYTYLMPLIALGVGYLFQSFM